MMYKRELSKLRMQIDRIDYEIIDKIFKLSQVTKNFKQKTNPNKWNNPITTIEIAKIARKKNLDEHAVTKIFNEIMQLIEKQEADLQ